MSLYRIVFETVHQLNLPKYTRNDPGVFLQIIPNSLIPEEDWWPIQSKETEWPWDAYRTFRVWAEQDREFVRKVRLEKLVPNGAQSEWVDVTGIEERPIDG